MSETKPKPAKCRVCHSPGNEALDRFCEPCWEAWMESPEARLRTPVVDFLDKLTFISERERDSLRNLLWDAADRNYAARIAQERAS